MWGEAGRMLAPVTSHCPPAGPRPRPWDQVFPLHPHQGGWRDETSVICAHKAPSRVPFLHGPVLCRVSR